MRQQEPSAAQVWSDPAFATAWLGGDPQGEYDLLQLPRTIAAQLVADETPQPQLIVDIASGAGKFLSVLLTAFPEARGVWMDVSDTMLQQARKDLAGFGDRVYFTVGDMRALRAAGVPDGADVVLSSRASHHLDRAELHAFYAEAAGLLAPGGWLANLDHIGPEDIWDRRYRSVRRKHWSPRKPAPAHHHNYPLTSVGDHLDGYRAAGLTDVDVAWKAFYTCLFLGRRPQG
ncbi:class I SAM-dependent methyltransferase [Streptomyces montanisoli]|uniref:Class I SAM-dependent methyltransferase n=1 Tax=Streptomyces montanisoli TaxID=2798581 RepID=A0A940RTN4_9ACTN|nr:class I SAM-dependent methyltransferase [Streptomyces montanisoli]MBP0457072.1 class I SAM-dependent methyltransferase [Streptomyces montanisoli]